MEAPTSATAATTLYDRNNPALGAAVGYLGGARPGGLYRIALAPDPETPPGAIVEFPYRLATVIGGQYYFVLDPAAARNPEQAAFMRAYMNEPGVTLALGRDAYTLPVRAVAAPGGGGGVRLVARTRPAGVSPDDRYYIGRSTEIDTVRRIDGAATTPAVAAEPIQAQPLTAVDRADLIALNPFPAPSEREQREQQRRRVAAAGPRTLDQLVAASQRAKATKRQAWAERFTRPRRGRGRKVGGRPERRGRHRRCASGTRGIECRAHRERRGVGRLQTGPRGPTRTERRVGAKPAAAPGADRHRTVGRGAGTRVRRGPRACPSRGRGHEWCHPGDASRGRNTSSPGRNCQGARRPGGRRRHPAAGRRPGSGRYGRGHP
ncbi:hypothetical protein TW95_gp1147 [Pandoravirus inopinatum]|uniref:Uncharacterized protein n=1 Tax=Pandoravirus inopinatum TaxID=1605721 RepID=A0A0B5JAD5_9VIRU|nr:hypothetical protein TW95_gp1147 [Pandoravirus inopinatum]AJF97881.1 hypothetical protein [Pandoravirus inopinatum]